MHNRNEVKWAPFNSLINGNNLIKEIEKENKKSSKPILSDDQVEVISEKIFEAFTTKSLVKIKYYQNGNTYIIKGIINFLNKTDHYIIINNKKVFIIQIIGIELINF